MNVMGVYGCLWLSMGTDKCLWVSGYPWVSILWVYGIFMGFYGFLWIFIGIYECL